MRPPIDLPLRGVSHLGAGAMATMRLTIAWLVCGDRIQWLFVCWGSTAAP